MSEAREPVAAALAVIDSRNVDDPRSHEGGPLALVQGQIAEQWVLALCSQPSDALRIAARAHHLRRWELPRAHFPTGRVGYLRWRRTQQQRHARELNEILAKGGIPKSVSQRAREIVLKRGLGSDAEVHVFEDAVSLTFLQTELRPIIDRIKDDAKVTGIVVKTLAKMSPSGREQAEGLAASLDKQSKRVVDIAVVEFNLLNRD